MLNILRFIHAFLGINAVGAGISVCLRMVAGRSFDKWVPNFLKFSLAASVVGLILSINRSSFTQSLTMLGVYASAFAMLSWRKYKSTESWGPAVVLSIMCILCLDTVVMSAHIFKLLVVCNILRPSQPSVLLPISMAITVLLFAPLSTIALNKIQQLPSHSVLHKVAR